VSVADSSSLHFAASFLGGGVGLGARLRRVWGSAGPGLLVVDASSTVTRRDSVVLHGAWTPADPDIIAPPGAVSDYARAGPHARA
jgi:hypothetical protein